VGEFELDPVPGVVESVKVDTLDDVAVSVDPIEDESVDVDAPEMESVGTESGGVSDIVEEGPVPIVVLHEALSYETQADKTGSKTPLPGQF